MSAHNFDPVEVEIFLRGLGKGIVRAYRVLRDIVAKGLDVKATAERAAEILENDKLSTDEKREALEILEEAVQKWSAVNQLIADGWPELQADLSKLSDSHQQLATATTQIAESFKHIGEFFGLATAAMRKARAIIEICLAQAERQGLDVSGLRELLGLPSNSDEDERDQ